MKTILYLCHYARPGDNRIVCPAAIGYVDYILYLFNSLGYRVILISPAQSHKHEKRREVVAQNGNAIIYLRSYGRLDKVFHRAMSILYQADVYRELKKQTKTNDLLAVYHSVVLMRPLKALLKKRRLRLVMQTNEIYGDVYSNARLREREIQYLKQAQGYIFTAPRQIELLDASRKPYTVIPGSFKVEEKVQLEDATIERYFSENRINVVYAGVLDPTKGALEAIKAAAFLPEEYHIHIIGFGREEDKLAVIQEIENVKKTAKCTVSYDGCFSGDEYLAFLQHCQIGLCTQKPDSDYNTTSFPSKILSYLTNGLSVVSISIPTIRNSVVGDSISYYEQQDPREIADAIQKIGVDQTNSTELDRLNQQIRTELKAVLEQTKQTKSSMEDKA